MERYRGAPEDCVEYRVETGGALWSPPIRAAVGLFGLFSFGLAANSRGLTRAALSVFAASTLLRAITNHDAVDLLSLILTPSILIRRTIRIDAPVDVTYDFLRRFKNYPRFMTYVRSVEINDQGGLKWAIGTEKGSVIHWDAMVDSLIPNHLISWKSAPSSIVIHRGAFHMRETPDYAGTLLEVQLEFALPAGTLGYAVAHFLGFDPRTQIDQDLQRLKIQIESEADRLDTAV